MNYELIVTIVNKGFSDRVVEATREAGAKGGTIIYGRGTSDKGEKKILGLDLQSEKEILFTIVEEENKSQVMQNICKHIDVEKKGTGLCFSLPIDSITGLNKL